jgi:hypothetical protein
MKSFASQSASSGASNGRRGIFVRIRDTWRYLGSDPGMPYADIDFRPLDRGR